MADGTAIEWSDATWNIITGCSVVSPGCTNCYAMKLAGTRLKHEPSRRGLTIDTKAGPVWNGAVRFNAEWLDQPPRWRRPRRIFVCAHGDLFADGVREEWIDQVFAVMALAPQHTFQVLTKRPARMRAYVSDPDVGRRVWKLAATIATGRDLPHSGLPWPLLNLWLGVSCEDQRRADERIPDLLATPAAIRFVSAEPLLGPIDFRSTLGGTLWIGGQRGCAGTHQHSGRAGEVIHGVLHHTDPRRLHHHHDERCGRGLDWIIVGGESGKGARPMHPDWVRQVRDQCAAAGTAFFFKQWGEWLPAAGWYPDHHTSLVLRAWENGVWREVRGGDSDYLARIGKKAAGRLLDGAEHSAFPAGGADADA